MGVDRLDAVAVKPGGLYRQWWIWTEPFRLIIRLVVERWLRRSNWMLLLSALRLSAHWAAGNPWWALLFVAGAVTGTPLSAVVVGGLLVEVVLWVAARRVGRPTLLSMWRAAWKFHRQWPRVFADIAAKTMQIQGMDGSGRGESRAAAIRPVVDHPRMPWRFWVRYPVITFRVGVAPGRTFEQFERVVAAMAANVSWVESVDLEYESDRDSFGLLHVAVGDVLARPRRAPWTKPKGGQ